MTEMVQAFANQSKSRVIVLWLLRALVAFAFLAAGSSKLAAAPAMVEMFATIGVGQWLRIVTGVFEVGGAIGLLVPGLTFYAALLLMTVMVGAIGSHLTILGGSPAPPAVLLLLSATIAWLTRPIRVAN